MPVVAMTREMGSLGKDVAARVAERIGKPLVHHEIIGLLADKMRLRKSPRRALPRRQGRGMGTHDHRQHGISIYTADETFRLMETGSIGVLRGWGAAHLEVANAVPGVVETESRLRSASMPRYKLDS